MCVSKKYVYMISQSFFKCVYNDFYIRSKERARLGGGAVGRRMASGKEWLRRWRGDVARGRNDGEEKGGGGGLEATFGDT